MKTNAFKQNYWLFDGFIGVSFGIWLGYRIQIISDSGEFIIGKLLIAGLIGGICYFLASLASFLLNRKFQQYPIKRRFQIIPSWIWIPILGSVFYSLEHCFGSLWNIKTVNLTWFSLERAILQFFAVSVFAFTPLICLFGVIRTINFVFEKIRARKHLL